MASSAQDHGARDVPNELVERATSPKAFLELPKEIRLEIYDRVFYSTTLCADRKAEAGEGEDERQKDRVKQGDVRGGTKQHPESGNVDLSTAGKDDDGDDSGTEHDENGGDRNATEDEGESDAAVYFGTTDRMFAPPSMPEQLNLVCRRMNEEVGQSWHGKVTYWFPCTVALLDVLGQWSQGKLEAVRHVYVCAFPLPLYPVDKSDSYCTHFIHDALPILTGLRLDMLTVENIWLEADGEDLEGWGLGATYYEVSQLLLSSGWKELRYVCGTPGFFARELRAIDEAVGAMRQERNEPNYWYAISATRPRLCGLVSHDVNGNRTEQDSEEDKAEVAEWEATHPDFPTPVERATQVRARRGTEKYAQSGDGRTEWIEGLMRRFTWAEMRQTGKYLVDDGMQDASAHL